MYVEADAYVSQTHNSTLGVKAGIRSQENGESEVWSWDIQKLVACGTLPMLYKTFYHVEQQQQKKKNSLSENSTHGSI